MATSMVGRQGPSLGDPMDLHGSRYTDDDDQDNEFVPDETTTLHKTRTNESSSSYNGDDDQAKRRAVNNLLAQLMPNKSTTNPAVAQANSNPSEDTSKGDVNGEPDTQQLQQPQQPQPPDSVAPPEETTMKLPDINDIPAPAPLEETAGPQATPNQLSESNANELATHPIDIPPGSDQIIHASLQSADLVGIEGSIPMEGEAIPLPMPHDQDLLTQPMTTESLHAITALGAPFDPTALDSVPDVLSSPTSEIRKEDIPDHMRKPAERGQIEAFAKLEFEDGNYYITTHSCELGRDVLALRAAEARERSSGQRHQHRSSSGKASLSAHRVKRDEAGMGGSVVSERGGFCGLDDNPQEDPEAQPHSSNVSGSDVIKPEDMHLSNAKQPFDYAAGAIILDDNEEPRPVDAKALLPSPDQNPLIPIHPTAGQDGAEEIAAHKSISRRHVRIAWNFERNYFELHILGRNGAFLNGRWHAQGVALPLDHGAQIQIGGVQVKFKLPIVPAADDGQGDMNEDSIMDEDGAIKAEDDDDEVKDSIEKDDLSKTKAVPRIKFVKKNPPTSDASATAQPSTPAPATTPGAAPNSDQPAKRRGPGRPPKDGIMSNRERREIEKARKLAAAREANGGVTPPPSGRAKIVKPKDATDPEAPKPEKRKYTKRKRPDGEQGEGEGNGEGGSAEPGSDEEAKPSAKKVREEKSPSPEYPPETTFSEEQLAKPPYNYTVLIFEALQESPKPLTLRNIYRALKLKYPYFVYRCPTDGWQSSVRHNLNGDRNLFEHAERDGKGWSWRVVAGATMEKEKKRKPEPIERPDHGQPRYPPPGARPPGQPFGAPYAPYPPYPPGAPPPPGMPFYPPPNMPPGQYPPAPPGQYGFPGQPPSQQQMGPPPPRASTTPGAAPNPTTPPVPSGMGILKPSPAPPAPQPYHPPQPPNPPNRPQPPAQNRPAGPPGNQAAAGAAAPPPPPEPLKLDPMLPCTPEGLYTIQNFEYAIYADTPDREERKRLQDAFGSVRARVLGGRKQSILPSGETKHEQVLLGHVQKIVERFPNPIYNAEMVRRREEERERVELENRLKAIQAQTVKGVSPSTISGQASPAPGTPSTAAPATASVPTAPNASATPPGAGSTSVPPAAVPAVGSIPATTSVSTVPAPSAIPTAMAASATPPAPVATTPSSSTVPTTPAIAGSSAAPEPVSTSASTPANNITTEASQPATVTTETPTVASVPPNVTPAPVVTGTVQPAQGKEEEKEADGDVKMTDYDATTNTTSTSTTTTTTNTTETKPKDEAKTD